jgi:thymidylate kinase
VLQSTLAKKGVAISISGIDGCGKTTLAQDLVQALDASNVPVRSLHLYQWYINIVATPLLLLYNRYFGHKVLVLDRCIYDNIAVATIQRRYPSRLLRAILIVAFACYPKFDYRFYLVTSFTETRRRRPDTRKKKFEALTGIYEQIALGARYMHLRSDSTLIDVVLRIIAYDVS